jgi:hypothetical protein
MSDRAPRYVPLVWGLLDLAAATGVLLLWPPPSNHILYWARGALFGFLAWMGIWDLKVVAFASDDQIRRATTGDVEVWREHGVAAPTAFKLQDVLFTASAFLALLIFIVIVGCVAGLL